LSLEVEEKIVSTTCSHVVLIVSLHGDTHLQAQPMRICQKLAWNTYLKKAEILYMANNRFSPFSWICKPGGGPGIIPNEDVGQNEVIDNMHKIIAEWQGWFDVPKFEIEILGHEQEAEQVKVDPLEAEKMDVSKTEQVLQGEKY